MSAERECFKEIDKLVAEKVAFDSKFMESGSALVKTAIKEFMGEHQEVFTLKWRQNKAASLCPFYVDLGSGFKEHFQIQDPKLSACLKALESKFTSLGNVMNHVFGEFVEIVTTHDKTTTQNYSYDMKLDPPPKTLWKWR